jgi:signal transduction histidine kinase/DNA-binding response OmpR family regulator
MDSSNAHGKPPMTASDPTNILVVDDLSDKLLVYRTVLDELGQNVITARSGEEALRYVLQHDFSVILLDVNMPTMDGFETARLIRQRKRSAHTPIIFITAFADEIRTLEAYSHGAVDFILSPVVPEILRAKVRVFVELFRLNRQTMRQAEERIALAEERSKRMAAEEANRNLSFLAKCREVLGHSLDFETTAVDLARLAIPFLADWSLVAIPRGEQGDWRAITARMVADGKQSVTTEVDRDAIPQAITDSVGRVLTHGTTDFFLDPKPSSSPASTLTLPLVARDRILGVIALTRNGTRGFFTLSDQALAESLTTRAAIALDNAQLFMNLKEADRQRNEFLSMLAHELRNPLAPIRNAVEVMQSQGANTGDVAHWRDVIGRQVGHLVRLVDDLLDVSRITQGKIRLQMQPVDLVTIAAQAIEASRPEIDARSHQLHLDLPQKPVFLFGDVTRLAQIFTNLLNNAAKYTKAGGHIWVTAQVNQGSVVVTVRDTGIGIPSEMLGRVFDLFTQIDRGIDRAEGGLGIGLTLVRRLVEMHNGRVEVSSNGPGTGSEFSIHLPVCAQSIAVAPAESAPIGTNHQIASPCRVLVVDDNRDSADSLAMLLKIAGYLPQLAYDGKSALELANVDRPDIVLLDIGLPGIDGYEVARRLRANEATKSAFLVAISGYGRDESRELSESAGFNHHFVKPVVLEELLATLKTHSNTNSTSVVKASA